MTHPRADNWLPRPDEAGPSAEASLIQRRPGKHTGMPSAPHLILAGAGIVLSLALILSAAMLPSIECAVAAVLCAASVGVFLARACQDCHRLDATAPGRQHHS